MRNGLLEVQGIKWRTKLHVKGRRLHLNGKRLIINGKRFIINGRISDFYYKCTTYGTGRSGFNFNNVLGRGDHARARVESSSSSNYVIHNHTSMSSLRDHAYEHCKILVTILTQMSAEQRKE
eukprot:scaffold16706_cov78-Skeletonema_dohrnii-CCMP3373.AAC.1